MGRFLHQIVRQEIVHVLLRGYGTTRLIEFEVFFPLRWGSGSCWSFFRDLRIFFLGNLFLFLMNQLFDKLLLVDLVFSNIRVLATLLLHYENWLMVSIFDVLILDIFKHHIKSVLHVVLSSSWHIFDYLRPLVSNREPFSRIKISSCKVKGSFLISGFKKFTHLSRHCFPFLWTFKFSFSLFEIWLHCLVPFSLMSLTSSSSSLLTQLDFLIVDFLSWLNLYWHCESFLPGMNPATWIQSFLSSFWGIMFLPEQYFWMAQRRSFDSSSVQFCFA